MKHIKKMKIDIDKKNFEIIPSVQYDSNTRFLHINLTNGSIPFDLTGCSVKISGTKQDGTAIFNNCTIINAKKGFVEVELTEQINAIPGTVKCELKIYSESGVLTTKHFDIEVTAPITASKEIVSSNEFKALTDALKVVQGIDNKADKEKVEEKFCEVYEQLDNVETEIDTYFLNIESYKKIHGELYDDGRFSRILADAKRLNKIIYIPLQITLSQTFTLTNKIVVMGADSNVSQINYIGNNKLFILSDETNSEYHGYGSYYNKFKNITLRGNKTGVALYGIPRYFECENIVIKNFDILMEFDGNWTNKFVNCLFTGCTTWYKARSQNNAISFINCIFNESSTGFIMNSVYCLNIYGGNIEGCSNVIFSPSSTSQWSNINIDGTYIETSGEFFRTDEKYNFTVNNLNVSNCNINFFQPSKYWINKSNGNFYLRAIFFNNVFYKNDNSNLFHLDGSTPVIFERNKYLYFSDGIKKDLTNPFTSLTVNWNTQYLNIDCGTGNSFKTNGSCNFPRGFNGNSVTFTEAVTQGNAQVIKNTLFVDTSDKKLKFKDNNGVVRIVSLS